MDSKADIVVIAFTPTVVKCNVTATSYYAAVSSLLRPFNVMITPLLRLYYVSLHATTLSISLTLSLKNQILQYDSYYAYTRTNTRLQLYYDFTVT